MRPSNLVPKRHHFALWPKQKDTKCVATLGCGASGNTYNITCQSVEEVVAQVSTVLGVVIKEQREEKAWTEGVAIWVAVLVVSLVGQHPCCRPQYLFNITPGCLLSRNSQHSFANFATQLLLLLVLADAEVSPACTYAQTDTRVCMLALGFAAQDLSLAVADGSKACTHPQIDPRVGLLCSACPAHFQMSGFFQGVMGLQICSDRQQGLLATH